MTFKKSSKTLARVMWWKNVKMIIIITIVVIVSIELLFRYKCFLNFSFACQGLFSLCFLIDFHYFSLFCTSLSQPHVED